MHRFPASDTDPYRIPSESSVFAVVRGHHRRIWPHACGRCALSRWAGSSSLLAHQQRPNASQSAPHVHPSGRFLSPSRVKGPAARIPSTATISRLTSQSLEASQAILANHGNMSSPTVLFILDSLSDQLPSANSCVLLAFGPGLCIEAVLLKSTTIASTSGDGQFSD